MYSLVKKCILIFGKLSMVLAFWGCSTPQPVGPPCPFLYNIIGDGGFLSGEPCGPPCFFGIVPEITNETEAIEMLKDEGLYKLCDPVPFDARSELRGFQCCGVSVGINVYQETDIVEGIGFYPSKQITVEEVIDKYGEPDAVKVASIWFNWEDRPETTMMLYFFDINTVIDLGSQDGVIFNLKPSSQIQSISYSMIVSPSGDGDETGPKYISPWHGYGEYEEEE